LPGSAGQAEAGAAMQGGPYGLTGGFPGPGGEAGYEIYVPAVLRQSP
jgi:hypothetical protein